MYKPPVRTICGCCGTKHDASHEPHLEIEREEEEISKGKHILSAKIEISDCMHTMLESHYTTHPLSTVTNSEYSSHLLALRPTLQLIK